MKEIKARPSGGDGGREEQNGSRGLKRDEKEARETVVLEGGKTTTPRKPGRGKSPFIKVLGDRDFKEGPVSMPWLLVCRHSRGDRHLGLTSQIIIMHKAGGTKDGVFRRS